jgi:molecular chaperone IbpA
MRTIDFSPVFRSTIGFDRLARLVDAANQASEASALPSYPPYNIEKLGEDAYRITMAVAGFAEDDIDVTVTENSLTVSGKIEKNGSESAQGFLHRGIAARAFERKFELADHIIVSGAEMENGLLHIDLVRDVPEEKRPRKIEIGTGVPKLEKKAA